MNYPQPTLRQFIYTIFVFYLVTSIAAATFGALQPLTLIPDTLVQITQFGPTVGVLAVLLLFRGKLKPQLATKFSLKPYVVKRVVVAFALSILIFFISVLIFGLYSKHIDFTQPNLLPQAFWLIIVAQFIGAAGEEFGWRVFLQPYLQTRLRVLTSSIIVGLLWALWHVGIFAAGPWFALLFIVSAVSISVIIGELLRGARGNNLLIATVFHATTNLGLLLLFTEESGDVFSIAAVALSCVAIAIATVYVNKLRRLNTQTAQATK